MPRGDHTGPMGQGRITGRGLGYCCGYESPGFIKRSGAGRGYSRGMGLGRGYRFNQRLSYNKADEIQMLKDQAESLKCVQKDIEKRLSELEKE
ncbi:MAG TPA: DUF5320 domain-containing protein [Bacteroidales bacterium]|nr:MAG: hypothetical protein BWX62_00743 [Bacteroidetes bacterium ADurb.Bin037]HPV88301.1 DUF5320 domain-containing protein [Bacteroidales bacterium]HPW78309.1 DUF5320 domain-containing protein [Bacteroidales bacterium]HQB56284.1 DUF5320 domain-containing protein [Bacteroidales bacterium]